MPELVLHEVDPEVIRRLNERAANHGVSAEVEHREILHQVLMEKEEDDFPDLKALLLKMPDVGVDADFERICNYPPDVDWS